MGEIRLSDEQRQVVDAVGPAIVVRASAGTGKTEVVAQRVERLLTDPALGSRRVVALSYTNKAVAELRQRFTARLGSLAERVDVDTAHGFAHTLLRRSGTWIGLPVEPEVISRDADRVQILSDWLAGQGRPQPAEEVEDALAELDRYRTAGREDHPLHQIWADALAAHGAVDFPGIFARATELISHPVFRRQVRRRYAHLIVDEAQNLTPAQYDMITTLLGEDPLDGMTAMLTGDPNQSQFGWAGADRTLMDRFAVTYQADELTLTCNYRSAREIVALAERVAAELAPDRTASPEMAFASPGLVELQAFPDEDQEGEAVAEWAHLLLREGLDRRALRADEPGAIEEGEIAILARSAPAQRAVKLALDAREIEWTASANLDEVVTTNLARCVIELISIKASHHGAPRWQLGRLLGSKGAAADDAELRAHLAQRDDELAQLLPLLGADSPEVLIQQLGALTVPETLDADWNADRLQLQDLWRRFVLQAPASERSWGDLRLNLARQQRGNDMAKGVRVLSIHKAQGREFKAVAVVGLNDGQLPDFRATTVEAQREELSTFYVAVSRPTRQLLLTRPRSRMTRYGPRTQSPSPFARFV